MFLHLRSFLVNIRDSCVPLHGLISPWMDSGTCVQEDLLAAKLKRKQLKGQGRREENSRD